MVKNLTILFFVIISLFIFLSERYDVGFSPGGLYGGVTVHGLVLAKNLMNWEHPFFMYTSKELNNGEVSYKGYNRFPLFPFLFISIIIYPFEGDIFLQSYVARQIMNLFFLLSIIITFKLINLLVNNSYLSISVVLISFSSYYMLFYNNMVFNDIPALFGFLLALYCTVISQKSKLNKTELIFYSILPISLGWQPIAVFITWFLTETIVLIFSSEEGFRIKLFKILKQQSLLITSIAAFWGIVILGLQLLNEWMIIGGTISELPSVASALWRTGIKSSSGYTQYAWVFEWINFIPGQIRSIITSIIPFWPIFIVDLGINASILIVISILINTLLRYFKNSITVNKVHIILVFSGITWSVLMRQFVALHEFQSIFYIGIAISFYLILLNRLDLQSIKIFSVIVFVFFLFTVLSSNHYKSFNIEMNHMAKQLQIIDSKLPKNSKIYFDGNRDTEIKNTRFALDLFLSDQLFTDIENAEYVISKKSHLNGKKLTFNSDYNLFKIK